jgi:two-component system, response regulator PdtaR
MAGEKYIVAASDNPVQISVRNILNPGGFAYLGNCGDAVSLIRLVRSYHPDFIVVDIGMQQAEFRKTLDTIDSEMLCACILLGDYRNASIEGLTEGSNVISFCPKPLNRELLIQTVEMANLNFKRIFELEKKLKEMTENYETRKAVERAKWILMDREGLSEKDAYDRLRKKSMDSRMSMRSIAESIIFTYEI